MRKKKIQSVDLGSRQLSLDFESSGEKAEAAILAFVNGPEADGQSIPFEDLIARFTAEPHGMKSRQVAQLVLEMAADYKLAVEKKGERLRPPDAKNILASSSRWKNACIAPGPVASGPELEEAAALCRDLLGHGGGAGQEELCRFIGKRLRRWRNDFSSFRRTAGAGKLPGKQEIDAGLALIHLLLAIEEPHAFIRVAVENKSELARVSADVDTLTDFYRNKLDLWNSMLKSLEAFEPNREELGKDPEAGEALEELRGISEDPEPYDRLGDIEALVAGLAAKNSTLSASKLTAARETALKSLENRFATLTRLLEAKNATPDQKNRAFFRLQKIKKQLLAVSDVSQMEDCLDDMKEAYDLSREFVERT
ncbi:MAG: hypothetical protein GY859_32545 [Desulfobacterales bacterium]|nr:hypothetical protein [Desulfobacterales bacterium]